MILIVYIVLLFIIFIVYFIVIKLFIKESGLKFLKNVIFVMIVVVLIIFFVVILLVFLRCVNEELGVFENIFGFILLLGNICNMNGLVVGLGVISVFVLNIYGYLIIFVLLF